jgi:pimeloyl-ACP methyl ester carboxylesterase
LQCAAAIVPRATPHSSHVMDRRDMTAASPATGPTLPGLTHRRASVNGIELHYVEMGSGPLVVLLHGFPEFWWSWRYVMPPLAKPFRVVAADLRGYHLSAKPASGYDLATLASDVAGLIDHLGGPAMIAAHDWGGIVAYQAAMDHPRVVERLAILNAPHPDAWIASWLTDPEQQRKSWYVFLDLLPDLPEELYLEQFRTGTVRLAKVASPEDVAVYRRAFEIPGVATAAINYYRELVRDMPRRRHIAPRRITCPVQVLWGSLDVALEPSLNEIARPWIDDFSVTYFPDNWHWLAQEQPRAVTEHLLAFFGAPAGKGHERSTVPPRHQ